jgi:hypothetical protein
MDRVPLELYWHIFSFLPSSSDHKSWLPLARACQLLRKAALTCPSFHLDLSTWGHTAKRRLKDHHLAALVEAMPHQSEVYLDLCVGLTPAAMRLLVKACGASLRRVGLAHCKGLLTEETLGQLIRGSPELEELEIYDCGQQAQSWFTIIFAPRVAKRSQFRVLSLKKCSLSEADIQYFGESGGDEAGSLTSLTLADTGA